MDYSKPIGEPFCNCLSCQRTREQQVPGFVPFTFSAEPAKAEPVYTHVLLDYDEDGSPMGVYAELHTADSLVEAIALRADELGRFRVFELGRQILDARA